MVKIKLSLNEVQRLTEAHYSKYIPGEDRLSILLKEHTNDFKLLFLALTRKKIKSSYNVMFSSLQAQAFVFLWLEKPLPEGCDLVINRVLAILDKAHRSSSTEILNYKSTFINQI